MSMNIQSANQLCSFCNFIHLRYLINIFTGSQSWNRRYHGKTIHPTEKFISIYLFKILCVVHDLFGLHANGRCQRSKMLQPAPLSAHFGIPQHLELDQDSRTRPKGLISVTINRYIKTYRKRKGQKSCNVFVLYNY